MTFLALTLALAAAPAVDTAAPDFTLKSLEGKEVKLSSFRGKTAVLEWFNPECPYVKAAHTKGSLVDIDNSPDGEGKSPEGGALINYVDQALEDLSSGTAVRVSETKPHGCSVKYGS